MLCEEIKTCLNKNNSSKLCNYESYGENAVQDCSQPPEEDLQPVLREEVEIAVASLKKGELIIYQQNLYKLTGRP